MEFKTIRKKPIELMTDEEIRYLISYILETRLNNNIIGSSIAKFKTELREREITKILNLEK